MNDEGESSNNVNQASMSDRRPEDEVPTETRVSSFILPPSSFFRWLVHICRFALAALFLFTAGAKLWILKIFATNVASLLSSASINYERWQWPATILVIAAATDGEVRRDPGGAAVSRLQRLRALLRLRFARRAAGVRLLWQHHWESVGSEDGAEKLSSARACPGSIL